MHYFEFEPAPGLSRQVSTYWGMTVSPDVEPGHGHQIIPDGCISLVARTSPQGPGSSILGPRAEKLSIPLTPSSQYWGVRFWPDAGAAILGMDAGDLAGRIVAPVTGPEWARSLTMSLARCTDESDAARVANAALAAPVAEAPPLDPAVRAAVVAIIASRGEIGIEELAGGVALSRRQLERRFRDAVGLTPKRFARVRRVRSAIAHVLDPIPRTWSAIAAEYGYADHSHLVRDLVELSGLTPSELAGTVRSIRHGRVRP